MMLLLESAKEWLRPGLSSWESHVVTIAFAGLAAAAAGAVVLRWRDQLFGRLIEHAVERRRVAEDMLQANALLLATLESNRDGVLVAGLDGTILTFNRQFLTMWELEESTLQGPTRELLRRARERLCNPEALSASVMRLQTDAASEDACVLEFKDGRIIELSAMPQVVADAVVGRVWRCRDVTSHRRAQQQIQMLAHTVRSIGDCVSVTDMDDRVIYLNQAFLDTYGFEESDLMGRPIAIVRSAKNPEEISRQILPATLAGGWRGELWNRKKDGTDFLIFLSTSVVRDEAGSPVALVGVARDITEQKRTEEALARGRESDRIVTLAAGIAHEFNNQLQTVTASTTLALDDLPPASPARESLQLVLRAGERAANLTAQLLAYAGRGVFVHVEPFDLNDAVREQAHLFRALMPPGAVLELELADLGAVIRADRRQIRQLVTSLVTNAAEAMAGRQGRTLVRTCVEDIGADDARPWVAGNQPPPGRYVCLLVQDQGVGMNAETIGRIFDPFFSTKFQGRGMGLAAALGIARAAAGAIAVGSVPGSGTGITVAIPLHQASPPAGTSRTS